MKKIFALIITVVLMMSVCITAAAATPTVAISGNSSVTAGSNITFTATLSGCDNATSLGVSVTYDDKFEFVSGEMLKTNGISKFDNNTEKGTFGSTSGATDLNGNIAKITLKAKSADANEQKVNITIIVKNGSNEICNKTATKSVKINCATHSYGAYTKVNDSTHSRTCSVCGNVETKNHTWNNGTVTKNASCKEAGNKKYTCTVCNAEKNETIAKTNNHKFSSWTVTKKQDCENKGTESHTCSVCNKTETRDIKADGHKFSNPTVTKEPTCTEKGEESGKCSVCGKTTTNTIKAKGHKYGKWEVTKAATCTAKGEQKRECSVCKNVETKEIKKAEHDFENPVIIKEPTETETGLKEGKCKVCGETTQEIIPCIEPEKPVEDENTSVDTDTDTDNNDTDEPQNIIWIVFAVVGALVVIAVIVILIIKKKKV